jgi:hypothetical protein
MRKIVVTLSLLFLSFIAKAQYTPTPNIGLELPPAGSSNWNIPLNYNFNALDLYLGNVNPLPNGLTTTFYNATVGFKLNGSYGTSGQAIISNGAGSYWGFIPVTAGVASINGVQGIFTFNGSAVSCVTTTCTFTSGAISSVTASSPLSSSGGTTPNITLNQSLLEINLSQVGAGSSGTGIYDFSGATNFKLPVVAGYTATASGECGHDSTNHNFHCFDNSVDNFMALFPSASPPTSGHIAGFLLTGTVWTLEDLGAPSTDCIAGSPCTATYFTATTPASGFIFGPNGGLSTYAITVDPSGYFHVTNTLESVDVINTGGYAPNDLNLSPTQIHSGGVGYIDFGWKSTNIGGGNFWGGASGTTLEATIGTSGVSFPVIAPSTSAGCAHIAPTTGAMTAVQVAGAGADCGTVDGTGSAGTIPIYVSTNQIGSSSLTYSSVTMTLTNAYTNTTFSSTLGTVLVDGFFDVARNASITGTLNVGTSNVAQVYAAAAADSL